MVPSFHRSARVFVCVFYSLRYSNEDVMKSSLILEQIPEIFDALVSRSTESWEMIAAKQATQYVHSSTLKTLSLPPYSL